MLRSCPEFLVKDGSCRLTFGIKCSLQLLLASRVKYKKIHTRIQLN